MFSKTCTFLYICILSYLFSFLELFSSPSPFPIFFFLLPPPPLFPQTYLESKIFLNIQAVPSAVFYSNAVLITTLSSSIQFFSFLDALPSAPAPPGMTLMFLMFHILLISLFSSWYFSIFSFSFWLTLMSPGIAISIMHNFPHSYLLQQYMVSFP